MGIGFVETEFPSERGEFFDERHIGGSPVSSAEVTFLEVFRSVTRTAGLVV